MSKEDALKKWREEVKEWKSMKNYSFEHLSLANFIDFVETLDAIIDPKEESNTCAFCFMQTNSSALVDNKPACSHCFDHRLFGQPKKDTSCENCKALATELCLLKKAYEDEFGEICLKCLGRENDWKPWPPMKWSEDWETGILEIKLDSGGHRWWRDHVEKT